MKVLKYSTFLAILLLLQACLPDSFTKFKEEPAVTAPSEEGASGSNTAPPSGPCPPGVLESLCEANPATISYNMGFNNNLILLDLEDYADAQEEGDEFDLLPRITFIDSSFSLSTDRLLDDFNSVAEYSITPALPPGLGVIFDTNSGRISGIPNQNYGGTHTISMNFLGAVRTAVVEIILSDSTLSYLQENEHRLKIKVSEIEPFVGKSFITNINGKRAEIIFVDRINKTLYVKTTLGDDISFSEGMLLDNRANFLSGKSTITSDPVFVFGSSAIDGNLNQALLRPKLAIASVTSSLSRDYDFSILPSIAFTGLRFQERSACFDISSGDVATYVQMPNFTACENNDPNFLEIRGGSLWGQILPSEFPIPETPFQIQAQDANGNIFETTVSLEFAPFPDDLNFSLSQDIVAKLLKTDNFVVGDFISDNSGSRGVIKEIIPIADPTFTYAWITVQQGTFVAGSSVDNKPVYQNSRGTLDSFSPINARIETDNPIPASIAASLQTTGGQGGFITSGGSSARLILRNGNTAYIRVSSRDDYNLGNFSTGNALGDVNGNLFFAPNVQIININGQHLRLNVAAIPATVPTDANIVYAEANDGSRYEGAMHIRKINSLTDIEVEMTKGELDIGSPFLRLGNPVTPSTTPVQINSISTNSNRFVAYKNFGFKTLPVLEQVSEGTLFAISPSLPPGLELNQNTGEISGIPEDRADQASYMITLTNALGSRNFEIILEVKDYIGLINVTDDASSYILHKTGMGNEREPCLITRDQFNANDISERDIECILDGAELDIFSKGLSIDFTLGNDMCQFYRVDPYYFARFSVPSVLDEDRSGDANQDIHTGDIGNPLCAAGPRITVPADSSKAVPAQNKCDYDYSTQIASLGAGFNCDVRTLTLRQLEYEIVPACPANPLLDYDAATCGTCQGNPGLSNQEDCVAAGNTWNTFTPENVCQHDIAIIDHDCNGDLHQCVAGAGEDIVARVDLFNTNTAVRSNAEGVEKINTTYASPNSKGLLSTKHLANYKNINSCISPGSNFSYLFQDLENSFRARHPNNTVAGTILSPWIGNPYYTYLCLDAANNIQARIRLIVREWNESFRTSSRIDYLNPDVVLTPVKMDSAGFNEFNEALNSFLDWEPSSIVGGTCGTADTTFPEIDL